MQRMNVLLPEPEGPMRQSTSPRLTVRSMPRSTSSRPKCLLTCRASTIGRSCPRRHSWGATHGAWARAGIRGLGSGGG